MQSPKLRGRANVKRLFGRNLLHFSYAEVGLSNLPGDSYVDQADAAIAALAVLMQPRALTEAELKLRALRRVVESPLSNGDKLFLVGMIETYLPQDVLYDAKENIMFDIMDIKESWIERIQREGREQWREEGREEGKREMVLRLLTRKFGELPNELTERIERIEDNSLLDQLGEQIITADTLTDIHVDEPTHSEDEQAV